MTDETLQITPRLRTVITGLRKRKGVVLALGQNIHKLYPADRIQPEIFENITVPLPLPIAMMLLGMGCELIARTQPAEPPKEATP